MARCMVSKIVKTKANILHIFFTLSLVNFFENNIDTTIIIIITNKAIKWDVVNIPLGGYNSISYGANNFLNNSSII